MNRYEQRLAAFYAAFRELDAASMRAAYAPAARFQDPVFRLAGRDEIGAMWAMLCEATARNGRDVWRLDVGEIVADASYGRARWEAHYRFSATGRMVHNVVEAEFTFEDGLIVTHAESYDFWRWSRQALGSTGLMMGWTPMLRNQVRRQAQGKLERFLAHRAAATAQG